MCVQTLLSEDLGCFRFKASKGEAVASYCELLATQKVGFHRSSQRANKKKIKKTYNSIKIRCQLPKLKMSGV